MKKRPLALLLALLTLAGPATIVAARPGGNRGGGERGGPPKGAANGVVASVDATTSSFVLRLEGKRGRRRSQTQDVTVRTNAKTVFTLGDRSQGSFSDVAVGVRALVKGTRSEDGSLLAQHVALKAARPPKETSVKGIVDYIDDDTLSFILAARARGRDGTAHDVLVQTTAGTVFKNADDSAASFADLAEGDAVDARGTLNADGSLQATSVRIHGEDEPQPVKLRGVVDSVDAKTSSFSLRLGGGSAGDVDAPSVLNHTDSNTVITKPDGSPGSFADVIVGVNAAVAATRHGEGLLARSVQLVAPEPPHEVALRGAVASIDAASSSFILKPGDDNGTRVDHPGILIHTSDATDFQKADGSPATLADVVVGAHVGVKGTLNSDRSVAASLVFIAGVEPPHEVGLRGTVASVDGAAKSFVLKTGDDREAGPVERPSVMIHIVEDTAFQKSDGTPATFADVEVGAKVGVKGTVNADRSVDAALVIIGVPEPPDEKRIGGYVASLDAEHHSFSLHPAPGANGLVVRTNEHTDFVNGDGSTATFADLAVRMLVKCSGKFNEDGSFLAATVTLFPQAR